MPSALTGLRFGAASVSAEAGRLITEIATPGYDGLAALEARSTIMAGLGLSTRDLTGLQRSAPGFASTPSAFINAFTRAYGHTPGSH